MDFLKRLFGFPSHPQPEEPKRPETFYPPQPYQEDPRRFFGFQDGSTNTPQENPNFNIFTDPLEMHRYFEQQIDNMLKNFGMPGFGNLEPAPGFGNNLEPPPEYYAPDSREYYLKPNTPNEKVDKDLDGKLSVNDLDQLLKSPQKDQQMVPQIFGGTGRDQQIFGGTGNRFFNQSVSVKTIRNPDGSFETHRTVTDSEGNQETTVTKKQGEKEYTIIKKRDRDGKEEVHENMINMTEDEKYLFEKRRDPPKPGNNDLFDKFFK